MGSALAAKLERRPTLLRTRVVSTVRGGVRICVCVDSIHRTILLVRAVVQLRYMQQ